jgi:hypothetical protein
VIELHRTEDIMKKEQKDLYKKKLQSGVKGKEM